MLNGKEKSENDFGDLTYENILKKITNWDIFRYYIPEKLVLGKAFCSKLRVDKSASCVVKLGKKSNQPYYWDLSTDDHCNAVQYVMKLYNVNYNDALQKVNFDFGLGLGNGDQNNRVSYKEITSKYEQPEKPTEYRRIDVFARKFNKEEKEYWSKRCISEQVCKKEHVYAIDKLFLDGQRVLNPDKLLKFGYYFPEMDSWKIYAPYADKEKGQFKWMSNVPADYIENLGCIQKDKNTYISKSRKDRLILQLFLENVTNKQNETIPIFPDVVENIKEKSKEVFVCYDSDEVGKKNSIYYTKHFQLKHLNTPDYLLPKIKDWDGMLVEEGFKEVERYLKTKGHIK